MCRPSFKCPQASLGMAVSKRSANKDVAVNLYRHGNLGFVSSHREAPARRERQTTNGQRPKTAESLLGHERLETGLIPAAPTRGVQQSLAPS